ncbi:MAG: hypothetical protein ACP5FL_00175 [Thermoplasmatota archaeon]
MLVESYPKNKWRDKMKGKIIAAGIVGLMMLAGITITADAHTEDHPYTIDLIAGQDIDVGDVTVWNDGDTIYVTFTTEDGWYMTETHLHLAMSSDAFPVNKKGNPQVGHFYRGEDDLYTQTWSDTLPYGGSLGNTVYIAAHAAVEKICEEEVVVNGGFETPDIEGSWAIVSDDDIAPWYTTPNVDPEGDPEGLEIQQIEEDAEGDDGDQYAELDAYYPLTLSQPIPACESGRYILSYSYAPRPDVENNNMSVTFGDYYAEHDATGVDVDFAWTSVYEEVTGPDDGDVTLSFSEIGPNDQVGMFLDAVSVHCILEESAWAGGDGEDGIRFVEKGNWATYFMYTIQFDFNTLELVYSTDMTTWEPIPGCYREGYTLELDGVDDTKYYINTSTVETNVPLEVDKYGFYLNISEWDENMEESFYNYWEGRGVDATSSGGWEEQMWKIINNDDTMPNEPIFYLKVDGTDYRVLDGLQQLLTSGTSTDLLYVDGDYPLGTYYFTGTITGTNSWTTEITIEIELTDTLP